MIETKVPMDIREKKAKLIGPFTARQLICFSLAGVIDMCLYFFVFRRLGVSISTLVYLLIFLDLPIIAFCVSVDGMPMEKYLKDILLKGLLTPTKRKAVSALPKRKDKTFSEEDEKARAKREKAAAKKNPIYKAYK